ncbi:GH07383p, putative [Burkholderia pseudomallei 1710b]|uniref:GH07383p, putative n=1 Tax=Burkholderia pseudomallei (strain 1710b) TaxID=320372 RepID=Q3JRX6_BURP1|nr:GH07383p, putative [Burkholderia pseudomallei 1710b]
MPAPRRRHIDATSTPHRHRIDTASTPHRHRIDTASTPHRHRIDTASTPHRHRIDTAVRAARASAHERMPRSNAKKTRAAHPMRKARRLSNGGLFCSMIGAEPMARPIRTGPAVTRTLGSSRKFVAELERRLARHRLARRVPLLERAERRFHVRAQHRVAARALHRLEREIAPQRGTREAHVERRLARCRAETHREPMHGQQAPRFVGTLGKARLLGKEIADHAREFAEFGARAIVLIIVHRRNTVQRAARAGRHSFISAPAKPAVSSRYSATIHSNGTPPPLYTSDGRSITGCSTIIAGRIQRLFARMPRHISTDSASCTTNAAMRSSADTATDTGDIVASITWMRSARSAGIVCSCAFSSPRFASHAR